MKLFGSNNRKDQHKESANKQPPAESLRYDDAHEPEVEPEVDLEELNSIIQAVQKATEEENISESKEQPEDIPPVHPAVQNRSLQDDAYAYAEFIQQTAAEQSAEKPEKKKRVWLRALVTVFAVLALIFVSMFVAYKLVVQPPQTNTRMRSDVITKPDAVIDVSDAENEEAKQETSIRNEDVFTFVVLGMDDGHGNTDTIMVVSFDTKEHKLNVVNIPRDTLVNVSWSLKKANTLYASNGIDGMIQDLSKILGYEVDFHVIVDIEAFKVLIDAIGGVDYDVPVDMHYDADEISIHINAGMQHLDGENALKVVRFRSGYAMADIGRIGTQQDFLMTAAQQILANKNSLDIKTLANVFLDYVETDLPYGNLIWLAQEFFKLGQEDISFHTLPGNYGDYVYQGGEAVSYVTILMDEWLEMLNTYLNPFSVQIEPEILSILTRNPDTGEIYSTDGIYEGDPSWGNW